MLWNNAELNKKSVAVITGETIEIKSKEELFYILEIIQDVIDISYDSKQIIEKSSYSFDKKTMNFQYLNLSCTKYGFFLSIIITDKNNSFRRLDQPSGVLAYVYNLFDPIMSELGQVYFERVEDVYYRKM